MERFWNEQFWLPSNVSWADLKDSASEKYPHLEDFCLVLPFAVVILVVRYLFESLLGRPLGVFLGVPTTRTITAEPNPFLENVFTRETSRPTSSRIQGISKQVDMSPREVERWFRKRRSQMHTPKIDKFTESCWRLVYYTSLFAYGVTHIPREEWFWDLSMFWHGFPLHSVTPAMSNLYFFELSFYLSLIISACNDVKRKDFYPMFCHHIFTSLLLLFSWVCNFVRIGCVIIVIHDVSDVFLEFGKSSNYAKWPLTAHVAFAGFALSFFVCRIVFLPFWVLHSSMLTSWRIVGPFPAWFLFNGLLTVMQALNIYWFFYIAKMVFALLFVDQENSGPQDIRSEDDSLDSDMEPAEELPDEVVGPNGDSILRNNHTIHDGISNGTS